MVLTATPDRRLEAEQRPRKQFFPGASVTVLDLPDGRLPEHWGEVKAGPGGLGRLHQPDLLFAPRIDDAHQDHRLSGSWPAPSGGTP